MQIQVIGLSKENFDSQDWDGEGQFCHILPFQNYDLLPLMFCSCYGTAEKRIVHTKQASKSETLSSGYFISLVVLIKSGLQFEREGQVSSRIVIKTSGRIEKSLRFTIFASMLSNMRLNDDN